MPKLINRRQVFHATAATISAAGAINFSRSTLASESELAESTNLKQGTRILFQGDSITDARRDRKTSSANQPRGLGDGYPFLIASGILLDHPTAKPQIFNRGISGNKVPDLANRWQKDCIDLKPDVLSILVGVNDIWHKLSGRYNGTVADYESGYRRLLEDTKSKLPETRIVTCEPFVLRCGAVKDSWFPEFTQRLEAARRVADSMSLELVPFQEMFDEAVTVAEPSYWAGDGVHPTMAGHALMAATWREIVGI